MDQPFWEQVANIPWIAYVAFLIILRSGYRMTKPSIIPVRMLSIVLTVLILMTVAGVLSATQNALAILLTSLSGLTLGIYSGWNLYKNQQVKAIKGKKRLYLPGSYSSLVILGSFMGVQLAYYIVHLNKPEWQSNLLSSILWFTLYSFFSGLFIGRLAYASRCLKKGPFIDEAEAKMLTSVAK